MQQGKIIRLIFYFTALLLAAKPFVGFGLSGHLTSRVQTNIIAKVFSKRVKENNNTDYSHIQQSLSNPMSRFLLRFCFLLSLLFPFVNLVNQVTNRALRHLFFNLYYPPLNPVNGQLLI